MQIPPYLKKATEWTFWTFAICLAQLWYDMLGQGFKGAINWYELLKSGGVLFVIFAVVVGMAVDFFLDTKKAKSQVFWKRFVFLGIPGAVMFFVFWAYALVARGLSVQEEATFVAINFYALGLTLVYTVGVKSYLYFE